MRLVARLQQLLVVARSYFREQTLARSRGGMLPLVSVVMCNGKVRLDGPTVNYSHGTLHAILAEAMARIDVRGRAPRSVLLLGLGAGSAVQLLRVEHGIAAPIVAVELDPEVLRLANEHFGLSRWPALEIVQGDALSFVVADRRTFDLVVVDVFLDGAVPEPFRQRPFLLALRGRLSADGVMLFNVVADTPARRACVAALAEELQVVFPGALAMSIRSNAVFVARRAAT